jgi:hypothetical protein
MRRLRALVVIMLITGIMAVPATAEAHYECFDVEGHGLLDFGTTGEGVAYLTVGGEAQTVPFFPTGLRELDENVLDIRFVFLFEQGPLVVVEHSFSTPIGGSLVAFDSDLDVKKGGAGALHWFGVADQAAGVADIESVIGEVCFVG